MLEIFLNYSWPGNLREFRNVIRRAALLAPAGLVQASALPPEITNANFSFTNQPEQPQPRPVLANNKSDLKNAASQAEYETIMNVLKQVNYNKSKAAEILKIDRKTLYNKIKNIEPQ